jgi:hypothetical protein
VTAPCNNKWVTARIRMEKNIETRSNVHCQCLGLWVLHTRMCCRRNRELIFSTTHQRERRANKEKGI